MAFIKNAAVLALVFLCNLSAATPRLYTPPTLTYRDLLGFDALSQRELVLTLRQAVSEVGLLTITNVPSLHSLQHNAFESAAKCFATEHFHLGNALQTLLPPHGDTIRATFGRIRPKPLHTGLQEEKSCRELEERSELLSAVVHRVVHTVAYALEVAASGEAGGREAAGVSVWQTIAAAAHVEHWHAYKRQVNRYDRRLAGRVWELVSLFGLV